MWIVSKLPIPPYVKGFIICNILNRSQENAKINNYRINEFQNLKKNRNLLIFQFWKF